MELTGFRFPQSISFLSGFTAVSIVSVILSIIVGQFGEMINSLLFVWLCVGVGKLILRIFKR